MGEWGMKGKKRVVLVVLGLTNQECEAMLAVLAVLVVSSVRRCMSVNRSHPRPRTSGRMKASSALAM